MAAQPVAPASPTPAAAQAIAASRSSGAKQRSSAWVSESPAFAAYSIHASSATSATRAKSPACRASIRMSAHSTEGLS